MKARRASFIRDVTLILLSIIATIILVQTGALENVLLAEQNIKFLESFIAGIFFTSAFTTAPAIALLGKIAQYNSAINTAFFGALGALCGDAILFRFIRNNLTGDFLYLMGKRKPVRFLHLFRSRLFHWFTPFIAALILASPLPDEIAIILMGFSKTRPSSFIIASFLANFAGIFAIASIAQNIN